MFTTEIGRNCIPSNKVNNLEKTDSTEITKLQNVKAAESVGSRLFIKIFTGNASHIPNTGLSGILLSARSQYY